MRSLAIIFFVVYIGMFLFGKITVNGDTKPRMLKRAVACAWGSLVLTLLVGLPVLGLVYLITNP